MDARFSHILEAVREDLEKVWGEDAADASCEGVFAEDVDAYLTELADTARQAYGLSDDRAVEVVFESVADLVEDSFLPVMPEDDDGSLEWLEAAEEIGLRGFVLHAARAASLDQG